MTSNSPETLGFRAEGLARIGPALQRYIDENRFPGFISLVARGGRIVHFEQFGLRDPDTAAPMAPDTIFRVYSMTKPVICTAFMTLYDEGRFSLDDPVSRFLPAFGKLRVLHGKNLPESKLFDLDRPITIRHLLTHTSGLTNSFMDENPVSALYRDSALMDDPEKALKDVIADAARLPLAYQPGERWAYSISIDVVARLIEILSDRPLRDFLDERLFGPLDMTDTGFFVPPERRHRIAALYGNPDIVLTPLKQSFRAWREGFYQRVDVEATYPAASGTFARGGYGLFSTAADYFAFASMLLGRGLAKGRRFLLPETVDLMHRNHVDAALLPFDMGGMKMHGYGFGLGSQVLMDVEASRLPGSVGEYGWGGAAKTHYWVDPEKEIIAILMTQYMAGFDFPEREFKTLVYQALAD